jgi:hypothetical protein
MSIPNKQIGWSVESNLLWEVLYQLNKLKGTITTACNKPPVTTSLDTTGFNFNLPASCNLTFNIRCNNQTKLALNVNRTFPNNITNVTTYFDNLVYEYPWLGTFTLNGSIITLDLDGNLANLICPTGTVTTGVGGGCPA